MDIVTLALAMKNGGGGGGSGVDEGVLASMISEQISEVIDAVGTSIPDWNQNDPQASDYIKNRPFYDNGTAETSIVKCDGTLTLAVDEDMKGYIAPPSDILNELQIGSVATVKINNDVFEDVPIVDAGRDVGYDYVVPFLGDLSLVEYPFGVIVSPQGVAQQGFDGAGVLFVTHATDPVTYLEIVGVTENLVKIPEKFLPDIDTEAIEIVELDIDQQTYDYIVAKSASEIISAYSSGKLPILKYQDVSSYKIYGLSGIDTENLTVSFYNISVKPSDVHDGLVTETIVTIDDSKNVVVSLEVVTCLPTVPSHDASGKSLVLGGEGQATWEHILPVVTSSDNGKILTVTNGQWSIGNSASGKGISQIEKTSTSGLVDTYTITYTDSTTSTFTVTNGRDGQNYSLTAQDKSDIAALVLADLPTWTGGSY